MSILKKIRRHGILGSARKGFTLLKQKSGYLSWRHRHAPRYASPDSDELERIEQNLIALGVTIHDYTPDPERFTAFQTENWFPPDYHGGLNGRVWQEKLLEHWISNERLGLMSYRPGDVFVDVVGWPLHARLKPEKIPVRSGVRG